MFLPVSSIHRVIWTLAPPPRCRKAAKAAAVNHDRPALIVNDALYPEDYDTLKAILSELDEPVALHIIDDQSEVTLAELTGAKTDEEEDHDDHQMVANLRVDLDFTHLSCGRVVLCCGDTPAALGSSLSDAFIRQGLPGVIVASPKQRHLGLSVPSIMRDISRTYADVHGLYNPLKTTATHGGSSVPPHAHVSLMAVMDEANVPTVGGSYRQDASSLVVLDNLYTEDERMSIMRWLTGQGDQSSKRIPSDEDLPDPLKWDLTTSDYGDGVTSQQQWGLREHVVQNLAKDPPPAILAIQSRLINIYRDTHDICLMNATALSGDYMEPLELSSFVANAVEYGGHYDWHLDMDPSNLDPSSPWAMLHGCYFNREPNRPLFVTMLIYPQEDWPARFDAETLFLDPASAVGAFVRPKPYRVVLSDQDLTHRISAPSQLAERPRYSLVWKLVFLPKRQHQSHDNDHVDYNNIIKREWGEPIHLGKTIELQKRAG